MPQLPSRLVSIAPDRIRHSGGKAYVVKELDCGVSDSDDQPGISMLRLFEDGIEIGPEHSIHIDILERGGGRFSHWKNELLFSSSDNSDCRENRHAYQVLTGDREKAPDGLPVSALPKGALLHIQRGTMAYRYRGIDCLKCPFDLAIYLQLLWEMKPRSIIEFGTWRGGSALWLADMMTTYGLDCHVYSFDITQVPSWTDSRITFRQGDVLRIADVAGSDWVKRLPRPLMVIEDAGHAYEMTIRVLNHFGPLMHSGEYLIIEDGITHEMGSDFQYDGGPRRAIVEFMTGNNDYVIDRALCDYYGENVTWNANGYLRRL